jgi:hypothetical protein
VYPHAAIYVDTIDTRPFHSGCCVDLERADLSVVIVVQQLDGSVGSAATTSRAAAPAPTASPKT